MKGSAGYLWLILAILMMILLYTLFGSKTVPEQTTTNQQEASPANNSSNILIEEEILQRRLQNAEDIWIRGVQNREEAVKASKLKDPFGMVDFRVIWDFFYPDFNCPHNLERLGRVGAGGKWLCGIPQLKRKGNDCVVYSYGIGVETSFEKDILDRTNCSVHAYDHTIKIESVKLPTDYPGRVNVSKLGIGVKDKGNLRTLKSEMNARGHKFIDVLNLDVEGAEFMVLEQIIEDFPDGLPFGQLLIEIHLNGIKTDVFNTFKGWWEKLEAAGLRAFHNEPNWYVLAESSKKTNAAYYEYSFINVKIDHAILHA